MIAGLTTALTVFAHGREAWSKTKSTIEANGELVMRSRGGEKGAGGATRYRLIRNGVEQWYQEQA